MYRMYFNRHADFPLVWSVDDGDQATEQNVSKIVLRGVFARTVYGGKGDNINSPNVWIEVEGHLEVTDNVAYITP